MGVDELEVLSDKGFYVEKDISDCENNGITVFMPIPAVLSPTRVLVFQSLSSTLTSLFMMRAKDVYVCPAGEELGFGSAVIEEKSRVEVGSTGRDSVRSCAFRSKCTRNKRGRTMFRSEYEVLWIASESKVEEF